MLLSTSLDFRIEARALAGLGSIVSQVYIRYGWWVLLVHVVTSPSSDLRLLEPTPADSAFTSMSSPVSRYDVYAKFTPTEEFWIDRHDFFYSRGYVLRPRYRPGWVPSWRLDPTMNILHAEDRLSFRVSTQ